jgi:hypothetical protein
VTTQNGLEELTFTITYNQLLSPIMFACSSGGLHPVQHIYNGKLADQLTVAWQYEPKVIYDFLRHEMMPNIPTRAPVQRFGDNIVNPKDHVCGVCQWSGVGAMPPPSSRRLCTAPRGVGLRGFI